MEQLEKKEKWRTKLLKDFWTWLLLAWALITQSPQAIQAQTSKSNKIHAEEVVNDSIIKWEFNPELIASIWDWVDKRFVIRSEFLRKDEDGQEYITINWNNYYNADYFFLDGFTWLWYLQLTTYHRHPSWFFLWTINKNEVWWNGILIQPNWDKYQWHFVDGVYDWNWTLDFWDWRHYEWEFHDWNLEGNWTLTWENWDHYEWEFHKWKRNWKWNMSRKYWLRYQWDWSNDAPIKDPNRANNPLIFGKWTYFEFWDNQTIYEVTNWNRPDFISVDDQKWDENRKDKRWNIVYVVKIQDWTKSYELHSWNRDISYSLNDKHFVFKTQDWFELKFPEEIWETKAKAIANLINSVMTMVRNNDKWYRFHAFDYYKDILQAQYKWRFFDTNLVKDIPWKIGISAKEFSDWLNHYRKDRFEWIYSY